MLILGDARHIPLRDGCVQTCVTSPPYFGLRDYGTTRQIGLERSPDEYVAAMVDVFREVKRVLRDDGTLWLNLGDSYATQTGKGGNVPQTKYKANSYPEEAPHRTLDIGVRHKNLIGIPWRVALALQQSYVVPVCVKDESERAWLAAMFDGEGCIGIRRYDSYREGKQYQDGFVSYTIVTNNDVELLEHCVAITGKGRVAIKQKAGSTDGRGIVSRRDSYGWRLDGNDAIDVVRAVYPYLIAKRKQAQLAFTLDAINKNKHRVCGKVPKEDQDKKIFCYESIKACNQRQPISMPAWIQEPEQKLEDGWYLRSDIIWSKPNAMTESVRDRPTKSHEYIFLLTKQPRYYYDYDAVKEPDSGQDHKRTPSGNEPSLEPSGGIAGPHTGLRTVEGRNGQGRNRRTVWTVTAQPYAGAHFATFPPDLIKPCILAGAPNGGIVFDPFVGSGTTVKVATELGRIGIGMDCNKEYLHKQAKRRSITTIGLPF